MANMAKPKRLSSGTSELKSTEGAVSPNVVPIRTDSGDGLDGFASEAEASTPAPPKPAVGRAKSIVIVAACVAVGAAAAGVSYVRGRVAAPHTPPPAPTGRAILNSRPAGVAVIVDGAPRGVTPLELDLHVGTHDVLFRGDSSERRLAVHVENGLRVAENVDMPAAVPMAGVLEVVSDPPGARVTLDGTAAGVTPVTLRSVTAARHVVAVSHGATVVNRTVDVAAGTTASVFVGLNTQSTAATGTFAVESPLELRILENGQLLGLSNGAPIVLTTGKHQIDLINEALELRLARSVTVDAGKSTRLSVAAPNGTLSVNASPWAEVLVDGRSVGLTPLGAMSVPIGSHEVVWRHPQLGEKRRTVVVAAQTPTRVTMDLTK